MSEKEFKYGEYFYFGAEEKYIADLIEKILSFYRGALPLVRRDINLSIKYRDQEGDNGLNYFVSVIIMETNINLIGGAGETAFELQIGRGVTICDALESILTEIENSCTNFLKKEETNA